LYISDHQRQIGKFSRKAQKAEAKTSFPLRDLGKRCKILLSAVMKMQGNFTQNENFPAISAAVTAFINN